jgi:hypothetical protein
MQTQNTVELVSPRGGVVLRAADGSYVLAQQIDAKPLRVAQVLKAALDTVGIDSATDPDAGTTYELFIEAYGLSRDAALGALA